MIHRISRRGLLVGASAVVGIAVSGCDDPTMKPGENGELLSLGEALTMRAQRLLLSRHTLAREYSPAQISSYFPPNGTTLPPGADYKNLAQNDFRDWRLVVHGLVQRTLSLSLADLKALPARTQITQHMCDEGWTAIGEWTGTPLADILARAGLHPDARYVVFHCLDRKNQAGDTYYESLDLFDAFHPQTILAYGMNGAALPVEHGAPLRLRAELQIGYKNAKYIDRIEVVDRLTSIGRGRGSYWADRGYQWYVGI